MLARRHYVKGSENLEKMLVKDIRTEKKLIIALIMDHYHYHVSRTACKQIDNYDFRKNTVITHDDRHIKISTETDARGVYDVLLLFFNGMAWHGGEVSL